MAKVRELSPVALEVLEVLEKAEKPMTLREIKEVVPTAQPAHLTALVTREKVTAEKVDRVETREVKTTVNIYQVKGE
jgi:hypothetical protein